MNKIITLVFVWAGFTVSSIFAAPPVVLSDSFPQLMTFRSFDNIGIKNALFIPRLEAQAPYCWIHSPGSEENIIAIKTRFPDKVVTMQEAYGGINKGIFNTVWPGHLLYKVRTLLVNNISATDTLIQVIDMANIPSTKSSIDAANAIFPFILTLYAFNADGTPNWSACEHVLLKGVKSGMFIVQRAQYGTKAQAFTSGKAAVATHMMFWSNQWQLNFSMHCPRNPADNLNAQEWYARQIALKLSTSKADGIEFDVGRWTWGNPEVHPMDANNDGVAEHGYLLGVNSFGIGGQLFFKELRRLLGKNKIIQVDSNSPNSVRGWKYLNGVQLESFPAANDFTRFSESFQQIRFWIEKTEYLPKVSYPFTKTTTTVFSNSYLPNGDRTDFHFRIGFASACLLGMPHPFAGLNDIVFDPENPGDNITQNFGVFDWDEYHGGDQNNYKWLGKMVSDLKQDSSGITAPIVMDSTNWEWIVKSGFAATNTEVGSAFSSNVLSIPEREFPFNLPLGVTLQPKGVNLLTLENGKEYTLEFEARGDDSWTYMGQTFDRVPRMINILNALGTTSSGLSVLVDTNWKKYKLSFVKNMSNTNIAFGVSEQIGTTEIRNIKVRAGGTERWWREFENGLVLLNMTTSAWTFNVEAGKYKRLTGTQDAVINDGSVVGSQIVVPAQDAVFLRKNNPSAIPFIVNNTTATIRHHNNGYLLQGIAASSMLSISDLSGRKIFAATTKSESYQFSKSIFTNSGIYIVSATDLNNNKVHFKIISSPK